MLTPGTAVEKVKVNDIKPLLQAQCSTNENENRISAIVSLKRHRKKESEKDISED